MKMTTTEYLAKGLSPYVFDMSDFRKTWTQAKIKLLRNSCGCVYQMNFAPNGAMVSGKDRVVCSSHKFVNP